MPIDPGELQAVLRRRPKNIAIFSTQNDGGSVALIKEYLIVPPGKADTQSQGYLTILLRDGGRTEYNIEQSRNFAISVLTWHHLTIVLDLSEGWVEKDRLKTRNGMFYLDEANFVLFCTRDKHERLLNSPYARLSARITDIIYPENPGRPLLDHEQQPTTVREPLLKIVSPISWEDV